MLKVCNLTKIHGKTHSVDGISFEVGEHEIIGLLGRNGAGKSTTMRMLAGYQAPTSGEIIFMGQNMTEMSAKARAAIGYLPELPPLYTELTVEEHLAVVCDLRRIPKKERENEIARVCELLSVTDMRRRCIKNLSKGYRQRVGFAAAIIGQPKFLILDEPAVGLDPKQLVELRNVIRSLSAHMSILLSSHMLTEITSVCTRIIMIKQGKIVADGTPDGIRQSYQSGQRIRILLEGDWQEARIALQNQFGSKLTIATRDETANRCTLLLESQEEADIRGQIYHLLADQCPRVTLLSMEGLTMTLEDIFMNLNQLTVPGGDPV